LQESQSNHVPPTPTALTIAGSDSCGGAGIQADLKTFAALGVYGASVITAITAQNTQGVQAAESLSPELVTRQLQSVLADLQIGAIKTGMLPNNSIIEALHQTLATSTIPLVVDPVMIATSGDPLIDKEAVDTIKKRLLPIATLLTPNLEEAAALLNCEVATSLDEMEQQAKRLLMLGCRAVLLKGGHLPDKHSADIFVSQNDQGESKRFEFEKVQTSNTHGTGCTLASAIAAGLAKGLTLSKAIAEAKHYLHSSIVYADKLSIGHGAGPVNHFHKFW